MHSQIALMLFKMARARLSRPNKRQTDFFYVLWRDIIQT